MPVGTQQRPIQRGETYSLFYATGADMTGIRAKHRDVIIHQVEEWTGDTDVVVEGIEGINGGVNVEVTIFQSGAYPEQAFKRVIHIPEIGASEDNFGYLEGWTLTGNVWGPLVDAREATHTLSGILDDGIRTLINLPGTVGGAAGSAARETVGAAIESATGIDFDPETERTVGSIGLIFLTVLVLWIAWKVAT